MFTEFIYELFEKLVSAEVAEMFTAPLATFLVLMLIFGLFALFCGSGVKRLVLTFILIITLIFTTFSISKKMGFIRLPINVTDVAYTETVIDEVT